MIKVDDFTKIYKLTKKQMKELKTDSKTKKAADRISFVAKKGEIFGLLGPNGAGKTTMLRSIATLLKPTEGSIEVDGFDVVKDSKEVRSRIGFLTNDLKMDVHFTPDYTFTFFARLHGMNEAAIRQRKAYLFDYFGIVEYKDKKISELSTGMTQKLAIAVSLAHDPDIIIFDEPTNGLDIITAKAVTDFLLQLRAQGKLVVVSTHIMTVAEKLCDRIAIIFDGKKIAEGTIGQVVTEREKQNLEEAFFDLYRMHSGEGE